MLIERALTPASERRSGLVDLDSLFAQALMGAPTATGVRVNERKALSASAVWGAVRVISESLASLPLPVYERLEPRGKRRAPTHPLFRLLHDRPNPEMSSMTLRETLQQHVLLWGNAYAEVEFDRAGRIIGLWPLLPDRTHPVRKGGLKVYRTTIGSTIQGGPTVQVDLPAERVLHIPGLGFDGLVGYSVIAMHRQTVGLALAAEEFAARLFSNGLRTSGVMEHPNRMSEDAQKRFRAGVEQTHTGLSNAHRFMILEEGMKFNQTSIPPNDAQFLETRNFEVVEVARIFRVPPHKIAELNRATFSNIEHQSIEFVVDTIRPWAVRWEQAINWSLFSERDRGRFFAEHVIDGLLRGDTLSRYQAYAVGRQWGWLSANDVAELENNNPLPGEQGDIYMVPLNMVPAGQLTQPVEGQDDEPGGDDARSAAIGRMRRACEPLFRDAVARVIRYEVEQVRAALKRAVKHDAMASFGQWTEGFHRDLGAYVRRQMTAAVEACAGIVSEGVTPDAIDSLVMDLSQRHVAESVGRLSGLDEEAAVRSELDRWESMRAREVAASETERAITVFMGGVK